MTPRAAWLTTLTLIVAMATYVMAVPIGELVLLLIPVTLVVRWLAYQRPQALAPPWLVAGCTFFAVIYAAYRVLSLGPDVAVLAEFVAVLALIKSLERWSPRDDLQMLLVAVFLVLAAIIESSSILVGGMLVLFVPLLGFTAMALQIEGALRFGKPDSAGDEGAIASTAPSRREGLGSLLGTFAFASAFIFTIAVVAFVLLPRGIGGDSLGGLTRPVIGRATGFRSTVELGRGGLISSDPTVVMEVELRDRITNNSVGGYARIFHLRGTALHSYDRGRWSPEYEDGDITDYNIRQAGSGYDFRGNPVRANLRQIVHLTPSASDGGVLFTVWAPIRIEFDQRQPGTIAADNSTRTAALEDSKTQLTTYDVLSRTDAPPSSTRFVPTSRRGIVDFENDTLREIAFGLARDAGYEPQAARRPVEHDAPLLAHIETWLSQTGGFTYTLDVPVAGVDQDPIEWFLTQARSGHCEYYASAMAALGRALGIDTRVVTGYMLAEYDAAKERYIVRRSNAHAWIEAEAAPGDWRTFDPTPNASALHVPEVSSFRFLRKFLDAVDGFWLSSVVSYDENNQLRLLGIEHIAESGALQDRQLISRGKNILRFVMILLMAGLAGLLIFRWYRKPAHLRASPIPIGLPHAALLVRERLLRHWANSGRPRPEWLGLTAHADSPAEHELAQLLTAAAFGSQPWNPSHTDRARRLLTQLETDQAIRKPRP